MNWLWDGQVSSYEYWLDPDPQGIRCTSTHGGQQCQKFKFHTGPHQEGNEVWNHQ